jgi:biotin carboxyl carrier protein
MNLERIEKLVQWFGASHVRELVVEAEEWRVAMSRSAVSAALSPPMPVTGPVEWGEDANAERETVLTVTAALVGIFRQGEVRLRIGSAVRAGDAVGSIESMKILNPVLSEVNGEVVEALIEDGQPVEYGQALFVLEPREAAPDEEGEQ